MSDNDETPYINTATPVIELENGGDVEFYDEKRNTMPAKYVAVYSNGWVELQAANYGVEFRPQADIRYIATHNERKVG